MATITMTRIRSAAIACLCMLAAGCDLEQDPVSATDAHSVFGTDAGLELYSNSFAEVLPSVNDIVHGDALSDYAGICGYLLAKGHARTSGASMIAGYVGRTDKVDKALGRFARAYADQTERDHQALVAAVARGVLPASDAQ